MNRLIWILAFLMISNAEAGPGGSGGNPAKLYENNSYGYAMRIYDDFQVNDANKARVVVSASGKDSPRIEIRAFPTTALTSAQLAVNVNVGGCSMIPDSMESWGGFDCGLRRILLNPGKFYYEVIRSADPFSEKVVDSIQPPRLRRSLYLRSLQAGWVVLPSGHALYLPDTYNPAIDYYFSQKAPYFALSDRPVPDRCGNWVEVRPQVDAVMLSLPALGLKFGFNGSGSVYLPHDLNGVQLVQISDLILNFSLWECNSSRCVVIESVGASSRTSTVFKYDFQPNSRGSEFLSFTPLGSELQNLIHDLIVRLSDSPRIDQLSWRATVLNIDPILGTLTFDAGARDLILSGQRFDIRASGENGSSCALGPPIAQVRVVQVDATESKARVDVFLGSRKIRPGDVVTIMAHP